MIDESRLIDNLKKEWEEYAITPKMWKHCLSML